MKCKPLQRPHQEQPLPRWTPGVNPSQPHTTLPKCVRNLLTSGFSGLPNWESGKHGRRVVAAAGTREREHGYRVFTFRSKAPWTPRGFPSLEFPSNPLPKQALRHRSASLGLRSPPRAVASVSGALAANSPHGASAFPSGIHEGGVPACQPLAFGDLTPWFRKAPNHPRDCKTLNRILCCFANGLFPALLRGGLG